MDPWDKATEAFDCDLKVSAVTGAHRTSHTSHAIFAVSVLFVSFVILSRSYPETYFAELY